MVLLNFINKQKSRTTIIKVDVLGNQVGDPFGIDVTQSMRHDMSAEITSNPIEDGSNVSDHVILAPRVITFEGFISNTPLTFQQSVNATFATIVAGSIVNNPIIQGSIVALFNNSTNRVQDSFKILEEFYNNKQPISIQSGLKLYKSMVFTNITVNESRDNALRFTASMQQIKLVQSETVLIPESNVSEDVKHTASSKQSEGKKSVRQISGDKATKAQTALRSLQGVIF